MSYRMAPILTTFGDLEGHFCCWNLCVHPPRWFACMVVHWRSNARRRQPTTSVDHSYGTTDITKTGWTEVCR